MWGEQRKLSCLAWVLQGSLYGSDLNRSLLYGSDLEQQLLGTGSAPCVSALGKAQGSQQRSGGGNSGFSNSSILPTSDGFCCEL